MDKEFTLTEIATDKLHYKRLREQPLYRLQCQIDHIQDEMLPPLGGSDETSFQEAPLVVERKGELQQLRGHLLYLQNKLNEHIDKSKKKNIKKFTSIRTLE